MLSFDAIDEARRLLDVRQKALCRAAGISPATYTRIKMRKSSPTVRTLGKLANGLEVVRSRREAAE